MGYIVLPKQFEALNDVVNGQSPLDSIELLWLPGYMQVILWPIIGEQKTVSIDEGGNVSYA